MASPQGPTRREFLKATSSAAFAAAATQVSSASATTNETEKDASGVSPASLWEVGPQRTFQGDQATQIAMPIGGIGAGSICMNGYGGLQDFSIRTRPETSAMPEGFTADSAEAAFAFLRVKGQPSVTKLVEGPFPPFKIFDQGLQGQGLRRGGFEGFPRFQKCIFKGEYPFGEVTLRDAHLPLEVKVTGWNPFIPLDDENSGIPCAILEYTLRNTTAHSVDYEFSYHLSHLAPGCKPDQSASVNAAIPSKGVYLSNREDPHGEAYGSAALEVLAADPSDRVRIKAMWLRSPGWEFDSLSALWREVSSGQFTENDGSNSVDNAGRNGGSVLIENSLDAGGSRRHSIVIAWHFPNCYLREGGPRDTAPTVQGSPGCRSISGGGPPPWRPWYASKWKDARDVALYVQQNHASLRARTLKFKEALFASTLPSYVLDAVSANLGILKSPTVLRQENGNLWGWEGCFPDNGCCHGSCTHVWNYAQAFPNLYPNLERTLRDMELSRSMDELGHVNFRSAIPDGQVDHSFHAAADGQLGGIIKVFREWQVSGDEAWLAHIYPLAERSIDYCIRTWDPEHKGALFEPHHNTYDIEFWGAEPMCTSIYIGALAAMERMAKAMGRADDASFYGRMAQTAAHFMDAHLFNGEYYQQRVQYEGLRDASFVELVSQVNESSSEMQRLLKREGPKYQYGNGCLSDAVIGAWMAETCGIETPLKRDNVRATLRAIFKHNFKTDLSEHANAQRPGYAMGHEPGLLLCSWPRGEKPTLPFVYSDEVWTGIEYQVAAHLIDEGLVTEGLSVVKALRSRYEGRTRNPWNEYECGNWYARAMASYALLGALSGFRYSAVEKAIWFSPRLEIRPFQCFFSAATGFGSIALHGRTVSIRIVEGELPVEKLMFSDDAGLHSFDWKINIRPGSVATIPV